MFSPRGVVQRDLWGRRTGSPSYSAYDGLPVRRPRRTARTTDFQSVGHGVQRVRRTSSPSAKVHRWINGRDGLEVRRTGDQNVNSLLSLKQPYFCVCKHRIPPRTPSPGPVVTTTGRGCVSPPGLMNANLLGSISLYCMSGHVWPLQSNSLKRGRPPQPPRPLLPRPKPRWRRGAKRLDGADVRCEV